MPSPDDDRLDHELAPTLHQSDSLQPTAFVGGPPSASPARQRPASPGVPGEHLAGAPPQFVDLQLVARGGMGAIYRARHLGTNRDVAIKVVLPQHAGRAEAMRKFSAEAQITAQLEHPSIVPVHDLTRAPDGTAFFAMKLVEGDSLATRLSNLAAGADHWTTHQQLAAFTKVCDALAYAHSRGVIHRDLKPDNIMLGRFGEVLVMDWGLAKILDDAGGVTLSGSDTLPDDDDPLAEPTRLDLGGAPRTLDGTILGTPGYMAPEQARGDIDDVDARSDVYALGVVLYELLTLTRPFSGNTPWKVIEANADGVVEPPTRRAPDRAIPRELEAITLKALEPSRAARYQSVEALRADVDAYLAGRLVAAADYSTLEVATKWLRRHPLAAGIAATILAVLVGLGSHRALAERRAAADLRQRVAAARQAVARLAPEQTLAAARDAIANAPEALRDKQLTPSLQQREDIEVHIDALRKLADADDALLRLTDDDGRARARQLDTLLALAELARLLDDYGAAELTLDRARKLGQSGKQQKAWAALAEDRDRRASDQARRAKDLIARARAGDLATEQAYRAAVVQLASLRGQRVVELLRDQLAATTRRMGRIARAHLTRTGAPDSNERAAGWKPLPALGAAVHRWHAHRLGDGPAPSAEQQPLIDEARRRLVAHFRGGADGWRTSLALAQGQALRDSTGGERALHLICDALGHIGAPGLARPVLLRYLRTDFDDDRTLTAGDALARLAAGGDAASTTALLSLVGRAPGAAPPARFVLDSSWWRHVSRTHDPLRALDLSNDHEALVATGRADMERRDHASALRAFRRALEVDPRSASAAIQMAKALNKTGEDARAASVLRGMLEAHPQHVALLAELSMQEREQGNTERARELAEKAVNNDMTDGRALLAYALAMLDQGDTARGRGLCDEAIRFAPDLAEAYYVRARIALMSYAYPAALRDIEAAIAIEPRNLTWRHEHVHLLLRSGGVTKARAEVARLIRRDPRRFLSWILQAEIQIRLTDFAGARDSLKRARALEDSPVVSVVSASLALAERKPEQALRLLERAGGSRFGVQRMVQALSIRADAYRALGQFDRALADIRQALKIQPSEPRLLRAMIDICRARGRLADALRYSEEAIRKHPTLAATQVDHANLLNMAGRYEEAKKHIDQVLRNAVTPDGLSTRALILINLRDRRAALVDLTRALSMNPRHASSLMLRCKIHVMEKNLRAALRDADAAVGLAPSGVEGYNVRALVRRELGDLPGALADLDKAISLQPNAYHLMGNRVVLLDAMGRDDDVLRAAAELLSKIQNPLAHYGRAGVYMRRGDTARARAELDKAIALSPRYTNAYTRRARLRKSLGDVQGAFDDYSAVLKINDTVLEALYERGQLLVAAKQFPAARKDFDRLLELDPRHVGGYIDRGDLRFRTGDQAGALSDFRTAVGLDAKNWRAQFNVAAVLAATGDRDGARAAYRTALALAPAADARAVIQARLDALK